MRSKFVRYWFRFASKPWLGTIIPSKHFVCLQDVFKTSSRHVFKTPSGHVFKMCSRRLQRNSFLSSKTSSRCLQDVFRTSCEMSSIRFQNVLRDVFKTPSRRICKTSGKTKNCYAEDMLKKSLRHILKMFWRRLKDQKMFAG